MPKITNTQEPARSPTRTHRSKQVEHMLPPCSVTSPCVAASDTLPTSWVPSIGGGSRLEPRLQSAVAHGKTPSCQAYRRVFLFYFTSTYSFAKRLKPDLSFEVGSGRINITLSQAWAGPEMGVDSSPSLQLRFYGHYFSTAL